ncbi:MAG: hypothetical protein JNM70_06650 [Anaerolineae bacterium]|nr:hypothetical protein [Anaerolineae bacterium]
MRRWLLANVLGWTVGLYLGLLNPVCFAGAGIIAGLTLGAAQLWALHPGGTSDRRWLGLTFAGAALGLIPASLIGGLAALLGGWNAAALVAGAILGGAVGAAQSRLIDSPPEGRLWWITANLIGGGICGFLTALPIIRGLPIGLLVGSALFGYLTGRLWLRWFPESEEP